jgi:HPt (histidine-containing phosphotransfer) domain-containing protein
MLGAQALASLCRQLEAAACEPHEALALVDELEREFERVRLAIEPRLPASD